MIREQTRDELSFEAWSWRCAWGALYIVGLLIVYVVAPCGAPECNAEAAKIASGGR